LPFLKNIADATGWYTQEFLADMIAVSESTPGPLGINTATYVGFVTAGIPGAIAATLGIIVPALVIVSVAAKFLEAFKDNRFVKAIFYGLRPASLGLICWAGFDLLKTSLLNIPLYKASGSFQDLVRWKGAALGLMLYAVLRKAKKPRPVVVIAASAVVGAVFHLAGI
ncbi:MAG: chromate transporter, partial [Firmicutes bacterium]|nr:chromate transporter [Bacillota bacterium]